MINEPGEAQHTAVLVTTVLAKLAVKKLKSDKSDISLGWSY